MANAMYFLPAFIWSHSLLARLHCHSCNKTRADGGLQKIRQCRIIPSMYTVIETEIFQRAAMQTWTEGERIAFINWLAANPDVGDVIPGSGGCRKVRWGRSGMGIRGGARVIYFNRLEHGEIWLLMVYVKAKFDNLPLSFLNQLREAIQHG